MTTERSTSGDDRPLPTAASPQTPGDGYPDSNNRDIQAKQSSAVEDSGAFDDPEIDETKVEVLPGTGGPDDVGYTELEPDDYNRTGH